MATNIKRAAEGTKKTHAQKIKSQPVKAHVNTFPEEKKSNMPSKMIKKDYYHIIIRPRNEFNSFKYENVGEDGHIKRLTGRRQNGTWDTQAWLINKKDAHVEDNWLIPDSKEAKELMYGLEADVKMIREDVFEAKSHRNIPQKTRNKPQHQSIRLENIRNAYTARMKKGI